MPDLIRTLQKRFVRRMAASPITSNLFLWPNYWEVRSYGTEPLRYSIWSSTQKRNEPSLGAIAKATKIKQQSCWEFLLSIRRTELFWSRFRAKHAKGTTPAGFVNPLEISYRGCGGWRGTDRD